MKKTIILNVIGALFVLLSVSILKAQSVVQLKQGSPSSIRGLSVVDDSIAWISGSKGYIATTQNGGKNWTWQQVRGFEKSDFRDVEAFSAKEAVIMSSGTPALILKTTDGGKNWQVKYRNADTAYFLDAVDFDKPQHGFVLGDPIKGKFLLMETNNGGEDWNVSDNSPVALKDEAAFAASGTCLNINGLFAIVTGGRFAEVDMPKAKGGWNHHQISIIKGQASQGAFSIAIGNGKIVVVGGDYQKDKQSDSTACYSTDKGLTWHPATHPPAGFQSCVTYISGDTFIATGTSGTNITTDGGINWTKIDDTSFNVCRKAKHGKLVLLAGNNGKTAILKL